MALSFLSSVTEAADADAAYAQTLALLLDSPLRVVDGASASTATGKTSQELLNFTIVLTNSRARLVWTPARRLNLPAAVARFVWMMAGSDRLADIAFYEPKVRAYTDDGISVPGSNYGQRILQPRPGLNQLVSVINRLKLNRTSRRAAITIYHPEDAVRESHDIPCAFGLFYHVREDILHATTIMRSNNAYILLPYNLFEFSLLAEVVATEVGVQLGTLTHTAASMHLFEEHFAHSRTIATAAGELDRSSLPSLPPIPATDSPVEQIRTLVQLEAELRHTSANLGEGNVEELIRRGEGELNAFWRQLYYLLAVYVARQNQSGGALERLKSALTSPWLEYLPEDTFRTATPATEREILSLELSPGAARPKVVPLHTTQTHRSLRENAATWEQRTGGKLGWEAFVKLEERFATAVAARGDGSVTFEEFESALASILSNADSTSDG